MTEKTLNCDICICNITVVEVNRRKDLDALEKFLTDWTVGFTKIMCLGTLTGKPESLDIEWKGK
ncbi:hypothetical protein BpHYR1_006055 [Brachionus plicatilis]|uniref:Uncharacterized protein n=1 Tax=Brachionus plicatilis TaxID=10195 RepID=A0A3M7QH80_BRAPC|nr:hypothetical protein BpHYR1_006055 [Brachionus plicatilis]